MLQGPWYPSWDLDLSIAALLKSLTVKDCNSAASAFLLQEKDLSESSLQSPLALILHSSLTVVNGPHNLIISPLQFSVT